MRAAEIEDSYAPTEKALTASNARIQIASLAHELMCQDSGLLQTEAVDKAKRILGL